MFGKKKKRKPAEESPEATPDKSRAEAKADSEKKPAAAKKTKRSPKKRAKKRTPEEQAQHKATSGKRFRTLLRIGLLVLIIGALITVAFSLTKFVLIPQYRDYRLKKELKPVEEEPEPKKPKKEEMGEIYSIKDLTVNTYNSMGRRFVMAEYALETSNKKVVEELKVREPQVRDLLIKYLRQYTAEEILSLRFQEESRKELADLINERLADGRVDSLYYTMLLIQ